LFSFPCQAILQLDSPKAARSMHSFLQQYPYSMGERTLTCTLSPAGEAAEVRFFLCEKA